MFLICCWIVRNCSRSSINLIGWPDSWLRILSHTEVPGRLRGRLRTWLPYPATPIAFPVRAIAVASLCTRIPYNIIVLIAFGSGLFIKVCAIVNILAIWVWLPLRVGLGNSKLHLSVCRRQRAEQQHHAERDQQQTCEPGGTHLAPLCHGDLGPFLNLPTSNN